MLWAPEPARRAPENTPKKSPESTPRHPRSLDFSRGKKVSEPTPAVADRPGGLPVSLGLRPKRSSVALLNFCPHQYDVYATVVVFLWTPPWRWKFTKDWVGLPQLYLGTPRVSCSCLPPRGVRGGSGLSCSLGNRRFLADSGPDPGENLFVICISASSAAG